MRGAPAQQESKRKLKSGAPRLKPHVQAAFTASPARERFPLSKKKAKTKLFFFLKAK